jgi:membrane protein implicated in regulation of membrane protease activity
VFVIVALVALLVLPSPWNIVGFAAGLVCFLGELAYWHRRVRGHRIAVGADTLVGEMGTVVSACRPDGQVRISGEIWAARCETGVDAGQEVAVVGRRKLLLLVEPARQSPGHGPSDHAE